jgi:hypothetical protein
MIFTKPPPDVSEESPRVICSFPTFEEWEEKAKAYYQISYHRGQSQRACYDMFGQTVFMETQIPWSIFEGITVVYKATDFNILKGSDIMKLAETFKGAWEEGYYADPGYGWPVFKEARDCYEFIKAYKAGKANR